MAHTYESGHARNVANFHQLIAFITAYGPAYNPTNPALLLPAITTQYTAAVASLAAVNTALAPHTIAVNHREATFKPCSERINRVANAAQVSVVPPAAIADIRSIARKLQGIRATPRNTTVASDPQAPPTQPNNSRSTSQMSFESRIENLHKLIQLLAAQPGYAPNELHLRPAALTILHTQMTVANLAVTNAYTALSNARIRRDVQLYNPTTGLLTIAANCKSYIKSLFGATSPRYEQVSDLKFTPSR